MNPLINKIKKEIKYLAKEFDLKYNKKWFNYMWISKRDEIILQYIGNCLDYVYDKYGNYPEGRIKNISKFFNKDLKILSKRYGGEVYSLNSLLFQKNIINSIDNKNIKDEINKLLKRIEKKLKNERIALITKSNIEKEYDYILRFILRHEWIHILLFENNLEFGKINNKLWMYDEGLCTYFEAYLDNTLNLLEARFNRMKYPYEKKYYEYSLKYKKLLNNAKTPKQRKQIIINFYKKLK